MMVEARTQIEWKDGLPEIRTARLLLRIARTDDAAKLHRYALRNRERLEQWEAKRPPEYYRIGYWKSAPSDDRAYAKRKLGARFRLFLPGDESETIGVVGLRDVYYGDVLSGQIGYSIDREFEGQGFMHEATDAVINFAFREFLLHRLEACCMPRNLRSGKLLERLGFVCEGTLRQSLRVNGRWEDHLLWSLLQGDRRASSLFGPR
jgi:ribosomal-protein-alanine N-acetyltransferase